MKKEKRNVFLYSAHIHLNTEITQKKPNEKQNPTQERKGPHYLAFFFVFNDKKSIFIQRTHSSKNYLVYFTNEKKEMFLYSALIHPTTAHGDV
jgi:hypothetical protein